ncbi:MAG TPA: NAD/NADP octopine/nopaline dehydrogenase family protein [Anaerolineae bacterium]|nr:NAD/NADP octopine/nopaline dehydrogenase family protein [Anaerolineae bacterium]HOQ98553.1 NAD/NADP octopine/nopaline dehydrogenase family protein [Anaerolineae bacterium]HPL27039.1 NAD/NADP octopine/nopaline dehydrogenase family protein [Anaerolineae bacterium]
MSKETRFSVIGAGHGGKAMAAHLALMGYPVTLYNRTAEHVLAIERRGGIEVDSYDGGPRGFGRLEQVTSDLAEAVRWADMLMVVVPSTAHAEIARGAAPHLRDGQILVLHPGRTGGSMEFAKVLRDAGCLADVTIAETETLIYASRSDGPAQVRIFSVKEAVPLAALPASRTDQVLDALAESYPQFIDGTTVLHTGMNNMGAIFHPALTLLNAGRIESTGGEFQFYLDGATPSVARVLEALDRERVTVAAALGIRARSGMEWLKMAYDANGGSLYEAIHNQPGYRGIKAPATLRHRYIFEDVPMSLVPIAALGQRYGVSVQAMDAIIRLACITHQTDFWRRGRTLDRLGIQQLSVNELAGYVQDGRREWEVA